MRLLYTENHGVVMGLKKDCIYVVLGQGSLPFGEISYKVIGYHGRPIWINSKHFDVIPDEKMVSELSLEELKEIIREEIKNFGLEGSIK